MPAAVLRGWWPCTMLTLQASTGTESTWPSVPGQETVPLQTMGRAVRVTTCDASADHRTAVPRLCPLRISSRAGWRPIQGNTVQTLEAANLQSSHALCAIDQTVSRVQSGGGVVGLLAVAGRITCKDACVFQAFVCTWSPTCNVRHTASHGAWHMAMEHASAFLWAASERRRRGATTGSRSQKMTAACHQQLGRWPCVRGWLGTSGTAACALQAQRT
jgi:hypothetical protein